MDNWSTKQKVIIQVVCLLLSTLLWVYVNYVENPTTTRTINKVAVTLVNEDSLTSQGLVVSPSSETIYVSLEISGQTKYVYSANKDDFTVTIDMSEYTWKTGENNVSVTIEDSPSNITISNSSSITAKVYIETLVSKEFEVESDLDITTNDSYYVYPESINPDTITVSGAQSVVDTVESVVVQGSETITEDTTKTYNVVALDADGNEVDGVTFSQDTVEVTMDVNEAKSVPIKINTTGSISSSLKLNSITSTTEYVQIIGSDTQLSDVSQIETESIDLSKVSESGEITVTLIVPDGIEVVSGNTIKVKISVSENSSSESETSSSTDSESTTDSSTTKEFTVTYTTSGTSDGFTYNYSSETVTVTLTGDSDTISKISTSNITAVLDLSSITESGSYDLKPTITLDSSYSGVTVSSESTITVQSTKSETETT